MHSIYFLNIEIYLTFKHFFFVKKGDRMTPIVEENYK